MKRLLLIICILLPLAATTTATAKSISRNGMMSFISDCRHYEGAEIVSLGWFATGAIKSLIRTAAKDDPDAQDAIKFLKGIHGVSIFEFEDCSDSDRNRITKRLDKLLKNSEVLMEVSDSGEKMNLYGVYDDKTGSVKDFVLYTPSDCALSCLFGTIPMSAIAKLAEND